MPMTGAAGCACLAPSLMGWMAPEWHLCAKLGMQLQRRGPSMTQVTTIGLDLAKRVFQVHGVDAAGAVVLRRQLKRRQMVPFFTKLPSCLIDMEACGAHSGERDQPFRLKVITDSGDRDHADHERLKPGVMVTALHAADISVGCMGMVGPVKSAADRPRSPWRGPRAPRSALASDGAARAGRRCGPPWAIEARAVMQRGFRRRQDVGARMVP